MNRHGGDVAVPVTGGPGPAAAQSFRFSRLGPDNSVHPDETLRRKLARMMSLDSKADGGHIPAGYTYLGQFIDHDLTFDRTTLGVDRGAVEELVSARSPTLDLDSLYGAGPAGSPGIYEDPSGRLRMGRTQPTPGAPTTNREYTGYDLPRDPGQRLAAVPDVRNDENPLVAQVAHLPFMRLHNRFVDDLERQGVPVEQRFEQARREVILHYHWIIRNDYLPRVAEPGVVDDVFAHGRKVVAPGAPAGAVATMPVEFSGACFRFGHSMVRGVYIVNRSAEIRLDTLFRLTATSGLLGMGRRLPSLYIADLRRFYDFHAAGPVGPGGVRVRPGEDFVERALKIDSRLNPELAALTDSTIGGPDAEPFRHQLAYRNLERAERLHLATGQQMHALLRDRGVAVAPLTKRQILDRLTEALGGAASSGPTAAERTFLTEHTPLWTYILLEAAQYGVTHRGDHGGERVLTGVGARIVVETIHRAMQAADVSLLTEPGWRPRIGPNPTTCRMPDLVIYPFGNDVKRLDPVGAVPDGLRDDILDAAGLAGS